MKPYILSVDQSTSSTKVALFNNCADICGEDSERHRQLYPKAGYVAHDGEEIYTNMLLAIKRLMEMTKTDENDIAALALTNQRETVLVWNKETGKPVHNAIVWQCNRAQEICAAINQKGVGGTIKEKTGLILSPYFSAAKVKWILDNVDGAAKLANQGKLAFGTVDSWLIWKLTDGAAHATDFSNASRTQLFNIHTLQWDYELMDIFGINPSMMPEVKYSDEIFGYTKVFSQAPIPITGILGDSHAALFGQNCFEIGMAKATYGTGSSIMINIGDKPISANNGIVTSIGWGANRKIKYVFEGNINSTGSTVDWLCNQLELIKSPQECCELAEKAGSNLGVYFVPSFVGLGAPYWNASSKAIITGLTLNARKEHVVRAAEESIAYQIKDVIDAMCEGSDTIFVNEVRVDGGPTNDRFLMQFQADILNVPVVINEIQDISALGSVYMAGLAVGFWKSINEIKNLHTMRKIYKPALPESDRNALYAAWKAAVEQVLR